MNEGFTSLVTLHLAVAEGACGRSWVQEQSAVELATAQIVGVAGDHDVGAVLSLEFAESLDVIPRSHLMAMSQQNGESVDHELLELGQALDLISSLPPGLPAPL